MARPVRKITDECHFTYIGLFSCGKEGGEDISGKMLLIENWLKKGESYVNIILCIFSAAVLLVAAFLLQKESVPVAPAFIALNAGEFIFLTGFIRLRWKW